MHFNTESLFLNTSTQQSLPNNQTIQLTPQQLENFVKVNNSQINQKREVLQRRIIHKQRQHKHLLWLWEEIHRQYILT